MECFKLAKWFNDFFIRNPLLEIHVLVETTYNTIQERYSHYIDEMHDIDNVLKRVVDAPTIADIKNEPLVDVPLDEI